jgi:hypothetical protein
MEAQRTGRLGRSPDESSLRRGWGIFGA